MLRRTMLARPHHVGRGARCLVLLVTAATGITAPALAQSYPPAAAPGVKDPLRPGTGVQPASPAGAQPQKPPVEAGDPGSDSPFSPSTRFVFEVEPAGHPGMPAEGKLMQTAVTLCRTGSAYSGGRTSEGERVTLTLAELAGADGTLTDSARVAIQAAVVAALNDAGIAGVACLVEPAASAQDPNTIKVVVAQIGSVRTTGTGVRAGQDGKAVDDARHSAVKAGSPLQPGDLLQTQALEDYLYSLSRFPGRTVSAAVTSEPASAQVVLDYFVQEKSIFDVFATVANTGTRQTNYWQERIGILATQLSDNDDILAIEYQTASFSGFDSVTGYYDARVGTLQDLRWRVTGQWGRYNSSQIGLGDEGFDGSNWGVQGELIWTFLQHGNAFLDLDASLKFWNSETSTPALAAQGDAYFVTASATMDALAVGESSAAQGSFGFEYTGTGAGQASLDDLGRTDTSPNWVTLNGSVYGSFYLDPLLDPNWGKQGVTSRPLVHEVFGSLRGQYAFDYRLTPLAQYVLGGLYTVRGFAQSISAGDSAMVGTVEYRLHVPRLFPAAEPSGSFPFLDRPFRWAPDSTNGASPDWDLVASAFFDGGVIGNSDAFPFEVNTGMLSAGIGLDLTIMEGVSIGVDWGWALNSVEQLGVQRGSSQFWLSASFVY